MRSDVENHFRYYLSNKLVDQLEIIAHKTEILINVVDHEGRINQQSYDNLKKSIEDKTYIKSLTLRDIGNFSDKDLDFCLKLLKTDIEKFNNPSRDIKVGIPTDALDIQKQELENIFSYLENIKLGKINKLNKIRKKRL